MPGSNLSNVVNAIQLSHVQGDVFTDLNQKTQNSVANIRISCDI